MTFIKSLINAVADPRLFFVLAVLSLVVLVWKRDRIASNAVGYGVLGFLALRRATNIGLGPPTATAPVAEAA